MQKRVDSWNCPIWASEEALPRLWSLHFPPMTHAAPLFLICSESALRGWELVQTCWQCGKGSPPLSASSAETTSGWQSSNAAVLFRITRRDGYRVDVVYLVFWFLMIILLYHEGYNLEGGLIQSSFILFIATLYITSYEVISHPLIWCISSFQWDWKLPKAGVPSTIQWK